jgi:hypothetical protein
VGQLKLRYTGDQGAWVMNRSGVVYDIDANGEVTPQPPQEKIKALGTCADWEAIEVETVAPAPKKKVEAPKKAPTRKVAAKKMKS